MYKLAVLLVIVSITAVQGIWYDIGGTKLIKKLDHVETITLPFDISLFGKKYPAGTQFKISSNGYISIGSDYERAHHQSLPLKDKSANVVSLVPYRARTQYRPDETSDNDAFISYKIGLDPALLGKLKSDALLVIDEDFDIKNSFAVTWNKLSFFGGNPAAETYPRNTFQIFVLVDGQSTFLVYNYESITWIGGFPYGGSANDGLGDVKPSPQAGFNLGNGEVFVSLPYEKNNVLRLPDDRVGEVKGMYVYKVSTKKPTPKGCLQSRSERYPLSLEPSSGSVYGGDEIVVSGVCFQPEAKIQCQFGHITVEGSVVANGFSELVCYAPMFYENGRLPFYLWLDGVQVPAAPTYYFVSMFNRPAITQTNLTTWRNYSSDKMLEMNWNSDIISNYNDKIDVKLYIYNENDTDYGWNEELTIEEDVPNSGKYLLNLTALPQCKENCQHKTMGSIVLELVNSKDAHHPGRLWTSIGPVGWYTREMLRVLNGDDWPDQMCFKWFQEETRNETMKKWLNELVNCPCSMGQAMSDFGRFIADPGCNIHAESKNNCYYHREAQHCVRSIWPSNPTGAGVQCCYSEEGSLIYAGDSVYGSTVDKSHSQGAKPYKKSGHIPSLSHWKLDVITYQYCCEWNEYPETCGIYMDLRPTKDCKYYKHSKPAAVFGLGHVKTFDGETKSLSKFGDHTLFETDDGTVIQARVQPMGSTDAFVVTGLNVQAAESDDIEITLNTDAMSTDKMDIKIAGEEQSFRDIGWFVQEFEGVKVMSWNKIPLTDHSMFLLTLKSGMGVQVKAGKSESHMNIQISSPDKYKNKMKKSVLGIWDGDRANDLEDADLVVKSKFSSSFVETPSLLPAPSGDYSESEASTVCGFNSVCKSDYKKINDREVAASTKAEMTAVEMLMSESIPVVSCGMPVEHGVRSSKAYRVGNSTRITGCRHGYILDKPDNEEHNCSESGDWEPSINITCLYDGYPRLDGIVRLMPRRTYTPKVDPLVLPLSLTFSLLIIAGFLIAAVIFTCRRKRNPYEDEADSPRKRRQNGNTDNVAYTMSSQGSMKLTQSTNRIYFETASRLSEDSPQLLYQPNPNPVYTYMTAEGQPPLTSYRMAVDPLDVSDAENDMQSNVSVKYSSVQSSMDSLKGSSRHKLAHDV